MPLGQYVFAVSVVSPFIKFKNASKETIDASEELVEEIRRALMQAGQKLSRHIKMEFREADLERKLAHIEQFGPILVESLVRITKSNDTRKKKAEEGLKKLLGRDSKEAVAELEVASTRLSQLKARQDKTLGYESAEGSEAVVEAPEEPTKETAKENSKAAKSKKPASTKKRK